MLEKDPFGSIAPMPSLSLSIPFANRLIVYLQCQVFGRGILDP